MSVRSLDVNTAVAVIGAGSMGSGIAQVAAQAGHAVRLFDAQPGAADGALRRIVEDLSGAVRRGRMGEDERASVVSRIAAVHRVEALAGCGLAVEAIVEKLEPKQALFRQLEATLGDDALFATNTSSISITAVAQGLQRPQRLVGWHFFNPATRMKLVEVIAGLATDPAVVAAMHRLSKAWGKTSVDAPNVPGFIVNRVARPFYAEAMRLLAERIAAPHSIDRLLREAGGFAMGPFELIDLIGVDVNLAVTESVFAGTGFDARYAPSLIQQELVRAGRLGRKTGSGFYDYRDGGQRPAASAVASSAGGGAAASDGSAFAAAGVAAGGRPSVAAATDMRLLAPLVERLRAAGSLLREDGSLEPETLAVSLGGASFDVALTDGRTAAQRRRETGRAIVLVDLAGDFASTGAVGATGSQEHLAALAATLAPAGIDVIPLADVAGLVVMRTVACLANEAADLLTWTSTAPSDIDTSMRLGTAYPAGPLAWAETVGIGRVHGVLTNLQAHYGDARYRRAPRLSEAHFNARGFHG